MVRLMSYANRAGEVGEFTPSKLPAEATRSSIDQPTVLFFYHPHCPCTRASVRCLERYLVSFRSNPRIVAYAFRPLSASDSWVDSETTDKLRSLKSVEVVVDEDARTCRRYDIATSGHVLVYSGDGSLVFSGGITASRGHEGECVAADAMKNAVNGIPNSEPSWPVFGCAFFSAGDGV